MCSATGRKVYTLNRLLFFSMYGNMNIPKGKKHSAIEQEENTMWSKGKIEIEGTEVQYWAKHFEEGSEWGIDGGRISKLECRANGKTLLHYERGWEMKPKTKLGKDAYAVMLKMFN